MKVKQEATKYYKTVKRVVENGEKFIQALALLTTTGFSYWALHQVSIPEVYQWLVTAALVIVGLRAFVELVKFLDNEPRRK